MTEQDARSRATEPQTADGLAAGEHEQLAHALETRFTAHLDAAAAAAREAERELAEAGDRLASAEQAAADEQYRSDPLVFMRATVDDDVDALVRKTTPKKLRASYRFLLDRAVELAAGEVQGFHDDQTAAQRDRELGVQACREALERATASLEDARAMQERVESARRSARQGLAVMVEKLTAPPTTG
ncbi:hypothetical protein V2J52_05405 [Georgenia sp. MJ173]|uniref:hypothetical protein n=1 Tax=Georgenia sunbinii TaxID=3117728 RepID=UPI002F25F041